MTKKILAVTNIGTVIQAIFADLAAVVRTTNAGLDWKAVGALGSAVRVTENTPVMVFNSAGSIAYVAFGAQTMSAPTGPTDGIPIAAGEKFVLNSGDQAWIRASAATV